MAALAANDDHNATPEWDFRGKLFLSSNAPDNGYWTRTGAGRNARLAGKIQTDTTDKDDGGPFFRRELDISIISNRASFIQAFREVSDFIVVFEGPEQLSLRKLDGSYGQIFVPNGLQYLGFDHDIYLDDFWIVWSESEENRVVLQSTDLGPDQTYYMYFLGNIDPFNFNEENPNTRRPWQETDVGAEDSYDPDLDLRLKPVISSKVPDHGRMAEVWPGFYTRWIGIVRTDGLGNFMETRDLSQIRQPTLTPITFDGVAEIQFKTQSNNTMLIIRRAGTSGIVHVGARSTQTHDADSPLVHKIVNSDLVHSYTESTPNTPLSHLDSISEYPNETIYIYMANNWSLWGTHADGVFACNVAPTNGYLSENWPGNQARWLVTIEPNADGLFVGSYILSEVTGDLRINDQSSSLTETWSASKLAYEFNALRALVSVQQAYVQQCGTGLRFIFEFLDSQTAIMRSLDPVTVVIFPDLSYQEYESDLTLDISEAGLTPGTMYRVWLDPEDGLIVNTDLPTETYSNLATREDDNRILCGYLAVTSSNTMTSFQNVASFWNEPERVWWADVPHDHNWRDNSYAAVAVLSISGLVVPQDRIQAHVSLSGGMQAIGAAFSPPTYPPYTIQCTTPWQPPVGSSTCRRRWPVGGGGIAEFNATSVVSSSVTSNPFELEEDLYASGEWTMAFTATVDYEAYADVRLAESSEGRVTVTRRQK